MWDYDDERLVTTRTSKLNEIPLSRYSNVEYVKDDPTVTVPWIDNDDVQFAGSKVHDTRESERMDIDQIEFATSPDIMDIDHPDNAVAVMPHSDDAIIRLQGGIENAASTASDAAN